MAAWLSVAFVLFILQFNVRAPERLSVPDGGEDAVGLRFSSCIRVEERLVCAGGHGIKEFAALGEHAGSFALGSR